MACMIYVLGPIYTVRFLSHATSARQAYDMTYDCRSVSKHVLKRCGNPKSCRRPAVSLSHATKIIPCKSALKENGKGLPFLRSIAS